MFKSLYEHRQTLTYAKRRNRRMLAELRRVQRHSQTAAAAALRAEDALAKAKVRHAEREKLARIKAKGTREAKKQAVKRALKAYRKKLVQQAKTRYIDPAWTKAKENGKLYRSEDGETRCPVYGVGFIAYKGVYYRRKGSDESIGWAVLEVEIAPNALRHQSSNETKMRVDCLKVRRIIQSSPYAEPFDKRKHVLYSSHDESYTYTVGKKHKPRLPFNTTTQPCASGLHVYLEKIPARDWVS